MSDRSVSRFDLIVVGSGIAGLYAALQATEQDRSVLVVTKGPIDQASTRYAQGGIAAAIGPGDSPEAHFRDTIEAGAGLVNEDAARILTSEAADRVADLVRYGVSFDATGGELELGREAAHSAPRILHSGGDSTGLEIEISLSSLARLEGVTILEHTLVDRVMIDSERVTGVQVYDTRREERTIYDTGNVVLATGGAGQMYMVTTNPDVSTGDGVALAYATGAEVTDLEFTQFHPTALRLDGAPVFLISEAVRGEGALLYNTRGERFMPSYDERAELATRDIVARATYREMAETGSDHVLLDITHRESDWLSARFPQIYRTCIETGIDMSRDRIPVSPAAHYTMGGVRTNSWGETTVPGLFAIGEVACTGVHGANRLASNSLLETVVFAKRAVERLFNTQVESSGVSQSALAKSSDARSLSEGNNAGEDHAPPDSESVRHLMWDSVGIVRDGRDLAEAALKLGRWETALPPANDRLTHELRSMVLCGRLAVEAALLREESRGAHYRRDFPQERSNWERHIVFSAISADGESHKL